jgi:molybdenum cofactor cytidylyltransferase
LRAPGHARYHRTVFLVDCIVLAAGRSERMGRWKPLLPFRGSTIVETVVEAALAVCSRVILVTGFRGDELAARFAGEPRVLAVENPDWALGMFSSIQKGAARVESARFFLNLGDMPLVGPAVYRALLEAPEADFVFPVHGGMRGHPVLLSSRARAAVLAADAATGDMKDIARRLSVAEIPWPDEAVLKDMDTLSDLPGR